MQQDCQHLTGNTADCLRQDLVSLPQRGSSFQRFQRSGQKLRLRRRGGAISDGSSDPQHSESGGGRLQDLSLRSSNAADWLHVQNAAAGGGGSVGGAGGRTGGGGAAHPAAGEQVRLAANGFGKRQRQRAKASDADGDADARSDVGNLHQRGGKPRTQAGDADSGAMQQADRQAAWRGDDGSGGSGGATTVAFDARQRLRAASNGAHAAAGKLDAALRGAVHGHAPRHDGERHGDASNAGRGEGGASRHSGQAQAAADDTGGDGSGSGGGSGGGSAIAASEGHGGRGGSSRGRALGRRGEPARYFS